jgi:hypothetical protein
MIGRDLRPSLTIARREFEIMSNGIASFLPDINTPRQIASQNAARSAILLITSQIAAGG